MGGTDRHPSLTSNAAYEIFRLAGHRTEHTKWNMPVCITPGAFFDEFVILQYNSVSLHGDQDVMTYKDWSCEP